MKKLFTSEQEQLILNNYLDMTYAQIATMLGNEFTERQIRGWINNNAPNKLQKINDGYFNEIDNPMKAYYLGFTYADGWIIDNPKRRNYEFGMKLQVQDKYILESLKEQLDSNHKITIVPEHINVINGVNTITHEMALYRVFSKGIVKGLEKNGVVQNKTNSDIFPIINNYFFDYLRGYIDGDGCYYNNKGNINIHITCSNILNLEYIQEELLKYGITSGIYSETERKYRLYVFKNESVIKLINLLYYDNCLCLQRKHEKIKEYLGL